MAAPDADRRKPADGHGTSGGGATVAARSVAGGGSAVPGGGGPQRAAGAVRGDAESSTAASGGRDCQLPRGTAGAGDVVVSRPPAIEVAVGTATVADRPGTNARSAGDSGGDGICTRFFGTAPGPERQISGAAQRAAGRPERTTTAGSPRNHTVMIK